MSTSVYNTARYSMRSDNTSGVRGVSYDKKEKKYKAYATHEGKQKHLGLHANILDAAMAVSDFRLENYPLREVGVCIGCKECPEHNRKRKLCHACNQHRERRERCEREGRSFQSHRRPQRRGRTGIKQI